MATASIPHNDADDDEAEEGEEKEFTHILPSFTSLHVSHNTVEATPKGDKGNTTPEPNTLTPIIKAEPETPPHLKKRKRESSSTPPQKKRKTGLSYRRLSLLKYNRQQ